MSKFAKALEQAQRERALRAQPAAPPPPPAHRPATSGPRAAARPPGASPRRPRSRWCRRPRPLRLRSARALRARRRRPRPARRFPARAAAWPCRPRRWTAISSASWLRPASRRSSTARSGTGGAAAQGRRPVRDRRLEPRGRRRQDDHRDQPGRRARAGVRRLASCSSRPICAGRPSARLLGFEDTRAVGLVDAILDPRLDPGGHRPAASALQSERRARRTDPASPYEILKSPRLGELLDEARRQYDYIVMDTPPLAPVQDCRVVARWVDGIVLVVAADHTPRALLEAALDMLDPDKVIGLVFNGYDHLFSRRHAQHYVGYYADRSDRRQERRVLAGHEEGRCAVEARQRRRGKEPAGPERLAVSLAVVEGVVLFLVVCGSIFAWGHVLFVDWLDVAKMLGQAAAISLCCIVAFYYNDLYDLRVVRSFSLFASRLLQSFGVALILLAGFFLLFPETQIAEGPFVSSLLVSAGLLVPLRAIGYTIMRRRAFADRVLILGTGPARSARHPRDRVPAELPLRHRGRRRRGQRRRRERPSLPGARAPRAARQDHRGGEARSPDRRAHRAAGPDADEPAPRVRREGHPGRGRPAHLRVLHREAPDRGAHPVVPHLLGRVPQVAPADGLAPRREPARGPRGAARDRAAHGRHRGRHQARLARPGALPSTSGPG